MSTINRSVLIVKPREPFAQWARSIFGEDDPDLSLLNVRDDVTAFLLPPYSDDNDREEILRQHAQEVFEYVLWEWYTEPSAWPTSRDLSKFKDWFDYEFHCVVVDLDHEPLERDDFEENG